MIFISRLSSETKKLLLRIEKDSKYYRTRERAKCIRLSYEKYKTEQLKEILNVSYITIIRWLKNWRENGLVSLYDQKGKGRKEILSPSEKELIKQWLKETPKQIKQVQIKVEKELGKKVSKDTIKRVVKSLHMTWHRIKKIVGGEPPKEEYEAKKEELKKLIELDKTGEIDLRYVDESGFSLMSYSPYGWQEKGEEIKVKSKRSRKIDVLGFMRRNNELESYIFEGGINSEVIIKCIEKVSKKIQIKTVLVMDKASIHTSKKIKEKEKEWLEKGLKIFFLPAYSPQLNLIEILWRFMKYEWLEIEDYDHGDNLRSAIEDILKHFGKKYIINFA
jgi:transposase